MLENTVREKKIRKERKYKILTKIAITRTPYDA